MADHRRHLTKLLLLWALVAAFAASRGSAQPTPTIDTRFTVFAAEPIPDLGFVPRENSAPTPVVFYPTAKSPRYEYRGPSPLRFFQGTAVAAEVAIPPDMRQALLLFAPLDQPAAGTLRCRVFILDDTAARQPSGMLGMINFSGLELSGTIDGAPVTLANGLNAPLAIGRAAKIVLRTSFKGRTYQSYAGTVDLATRERALLIFFPPYYAGSLEVQSRLLIDEPPPPESSPKKR